MELVSISKTVPWTALELEQNARIAIRHIPKTSYTIIKCEIVDNIVHFTIIKKRSKYVLLQIQQIVFYQQLPHIHLILKLYLEQ